MLFLQCYYIGLRTYRSILLTVVIDSGVTSFIEPESKSAPLAFFALEYDGTPLSGNYLLSHE
jgi:hypothetical protein